MEAKPILNEGDVVYLKSEGMAMTIINVIPPSPLLRESKYTAKCIWHDKEGKLQCYEFPFFVLTKKSGVLP